MRQPPKLPLSKRLKYRFYRMRRQLLLKLIDREWASDMLWDADNTEMPIDSVEELANEYMRPGDTCVFQIQRAIALPDRWYEVSIPPLPGNEDEDFEPFDNVRVKRVPQPRPVSG